MRAFSHWRVPVLRRITVRSAVEYGVLALLCARTVQVLGRRSYNTILRRNT